MIRSFIDKPNYHDILKYIRSNKQFSENDIYHLIQDYIPFHYNYDKLSNYPYKYELLDEIINLNFEKVNNKILENIVADESAAPLILKLIEKGYILNESSQYILMGYQSYECISKIIELVGIEYSSRKIKQLIFNRTLTPEQRTKLVLTVMSKGWIIKSISPFIKYFIDHNGNDDGRLELVLSVHPFPSPTKELDFDLDLDEGLDYDARVYVLSILSAFFLEKEFSETLFPSLLELSQLSTAIYNIDISTVSSILKFSPNYNLKEKRLEANKLASDYLRNL